VGTFVELEIVSDEEGVEQAKKHLATLAGELGLSGSERRSYLELLLER
jgi:adenylate cyclase class IV